ncbi:hypothetical protein RI367_005192 [Sorochytrium milnesiophthora]
MTASQLTRSAPIIVDPSSLVDRLRIADIAIQAIAFCMMCYTLWTVSLRFGRDRSSWFWRASLFGVLCLTPVPLFELIYVLDLFASMGAFPYGFGEGFVGDLLLRIASATIVICRFQRLLIVSPWPKQRSKYLFYGMSLTVIVLMIVDLWATGVTRLAFVTPSTPFMELLTDFNMLRTVDVITLPALHIISLATDLQFVLVLINSKLQVKSATKTTSGAPQATDMLRQRAFLTHLILPYLPSALCAMLFIVLIGVEFTRPADTNLSFCSIALTRFTPTIEAFVFFNVTIQQTRNIIQQAESFASTKGVNSGSKTKPTSSDKPSVATDGSKTTTASTARALDA